MNKAEWQLSDEDESKVRLVRPSERRMRPANETKRIIQCPACQTKFAVKTSAIENSDSPRFHCSRCDNVFSMEAQMDLGPLPDAPTYSINENEFDSGDRPFIDSSGETLAVGNKMEGWQSNSSNEFSSSNSYEQSDHGSQRTTMRSTSHSIKDVEETPDEKPAAEKAVAARKKALEQMELVLNPRSMMSRSSAMHNQSTADVPVAKKEIKPEMQKSFSAVEQEFDFSSHDETPDIEEMDETSKTSSATTRWKLDSSFEEDTHSFEPHQSSNFAKKSRPLNGWRSTAFLGVPMLGFLVLLIFAGFIMGQNPEMAWALSNTIAGPIDRRPPTGVYISGMQHLQVELESGELVHVVQGTIKNTSEETLTSVMLEGLTFNAAGKVIEQKLVPADSGLQKTRIESLSLEMIQQIQQTDKPKTITLTPGESLEFSLAMPNEAMSSIAYYSARIYSVRY